MLIGEKQTFAIECYHDPLPNESGHVFGRMCVWLGSKSLGDITEPSCMLSATERCLAELLERLDSLDDPMMRGLSDRDSYNLLNRLLYEDDVRSDEQVSLDADRFAKFDFLTNGGESFDHSKSFIAISGDQLLIVFDDENTGFGSGKVSRSAFRLVVKGFLGWVVNESANTR
ncbi:MAG: hypothetical protein AAF351_00970 [Pseudomonadota bacterium]